VLSAECRSGFAAISAANYPTIAAKPLLQGSADEYVAFSFSVAPEREKEGFAESLALSPKSF
jgi:hypothetical protein